MMKVISKGLLLAIVSVGCASERVVIKKGVVVGENDIQRYTEGLNLQGLTAGSADQRRIAQVAKSSVLIVTVVPTTGRKNELKFCSGSLIDVRGEPRILTNQHCFAKTAPDNKDQNLDELLPEACHKTRVYFNFSSSTDDVVIRRCRQGSLQNNHNHHADLATFALDHPDNNNNDKLVPEGIRPLELWQGELKDLVGRKVFTIHHPGTGQKNTLPLPDLEAPAPRKMITIRNCLYLGGFSRETWDDRGGIPYQIRHTCDLLDGSSGSGLIDLKTGKLLGVNIGSVEMQVVTSSKSKPEVVNQTKYTYNVATVAKFVRHFLDNPSQELPDPETEIPDPNRNQ